jgi:protein-tyrosine phosphatase
MAECLLKQAFSVRESAVEIRSAGLGAVVGHPADEHVLLLMRRRGLDLSEHRAVQVNREMLRWAQLVLIMEESHRAHLRNLDPTVSGKVMLLGHWTGCEVSDPYQRTLDVFEQTEGLIDSAVDSWMERL